MAILLLVDDDGPLRRLLEAVLSSTHEVRAVASAAAALLSLAEQAPDLLVTDFRLPDMDGLELYRSARERGFVGPVLLLTASGHDSPVVAQAREEIGSASVLLKPFDIDVLEQQIQVLLGLSAQAQCRGGGTRPS